MKEITVTYDEANDTYLIRHMEKGLMVYWVEVVTIKEVLESIELYYEL